MSDLPRIITTEQLRRESHDMPGVAREVGERLHPHGLHIAFEATMMADIAMKVDGEPCVVLIVTDDHRTERILHTIPNEIYAKLPTVGDLATRYVDLVEKDIAHELTMEVESWLRRTQGFQPELPFD